MAGTDGHDEPDDDDRGEDSFLTPETEEAVRDAVAPYATAAAAALAESMRDIDHSSLFPQIDAVRRWGLGAAVHQQHLDMIAKIIQPQTEIWSRLTVDPVVFTAPIAPAVHEQVEAIAKISQPPILSAWEKIDFAAMVPQFNITTLLPRYDFATSIVDKLDITSVFPRLRFPAFGDLVEALRRDDPPNWAGVDYDLDVVTTIIRDDGIPLVWVPRAAIVEELLGADSRDARVEVLLGHVDDLASDCLTVLEDVDDETLTGQVPLARDAVKALAAGHFSSAQALAVSVTETAVTRSLGKYKEVKEQVLFDPDLVPWTQLRLRAALAPIYRFYTTWFPNQGVPAPKELSRHVSAHQADVDHYSHGNAVIAVLLVTSVLRALQELQELAEAASDGQEDAA